MSCQLLILQKISIYTTHALMHMPTNTATYCHFTKERIFSLHGNGNIQGKKMKPVNKNTFLVDWIVSLTELFESYRPPTPSKAQNMTLFGIGVISNVIKVRILR